jgi:hypothetical protein
MLPKGRDRRPRSAPVVAAVTAGLPGQTEVCGGNNAWFRRRVFPPDWESKTLIPTVPAGLFPEYPRTPCKTPAPASGLKNLGSSAGRYLGTGNSGHSGNRGGA